jgi:hypothetical protein
MGKEQRHGDGDENEISVRCARFPILLDAIVYDHPVEVPLWP